MADKIEDQARKATHATRWSTLAAKAGHWLLGDGTDKDFGHRLLSEMCEVEGNVITSEHEPIQPRKYSAAPGNFIVVDLTDPNDPASGTLFAEVKCTLPEAEENVALIVEALNAMDQSHWPPGPPPNKEVVALSDLMAEEGQRSKLHDYGGAQKTYEVVEGMLCQNPFRNNLCPGMMVLQDPVISTARYECQMCGFWAEFNVAPTTLKMDDGAGGFAVFEVFDDE